MSMSPAPPPFYPPVPPPPRKEGMPVLGWVGIGCGAVLLLMIAGGVFAFFAVKKQVEKFTRYPEKTTAEWFIQANPDLEKVGENDAKGEMTLRTKNGETFTISYADLAEGKFSYKDASGKIVALGESGTLADLPPWVPQIPGLPAEVRILHSVTNGKASGSYSSTSTETREAIQSYFEAAADKLGLNRSSRSSVNVNGSGVFKQSYSDGTREIILVITEKSGNPLTARVSYREK